MTLKRRVVDEAVREFLEDTAQTLTTNEEIKIGLVEAPEIARSATPVVPYAIVYPIDGGTMPMPTLSGHEIVHTLEYQVTSVGETPAQAQLMGDVVREAMVDRSVSGQLVHSIPSTPGVVFVDRWTDEVTGGVQHSGGLFQVYDSYRVTVQSS